jgi:hypothetical protein
MFRVAMTYGPATNRGGSYCMAEQHRCKYTYKKALTKLSTLCNNLKRMELMEWKRKGDQVIVASNFNEN